LNTSNTNKRAAIVPRSRKENSYFITTTTNYIFYWVANLIVFPIYLTVAYIAVGEPAVDDFASSFWRWLLFALATTPVILTLRTPKEWHLGFKNRRSLVVVSIVVIFTLALDRNASDMLDTIAPFAVFSMFLVTIGLVDVLRKNVPIWLILTASLASLVILRYTTELIFDSFITLLIDWRLGLNIGWIQSEDISQFFEILFTVLYGSFILTTIFMHLPIHLPAGRLLLESHHNFYSRERLTVVGSVLWLLIALLVMLPRPAIALIGLLCMLLAAVPTLFFSRQMSHLRNFFKPLRHDLLKDRGSEFVTTSNWLNRLLRVIIPQTFGLNNRTLYVVLALIIGGIAIPVAAVAYEVEYLRNAFPDDNLNPPNFLELLALGVTSGFILAGLYLSLIAIRYRSRYIVIPFSVIGALNATNNGYADNNSDNGQKNLRSDYSPELLAIANLTTHILAEELQKISILMKLRQVENENLSADDVSAFFVTSGNEAAFIDQMQRIVDLELPGQRRLGLSNFIYGLIKTLARVKVEGKVQQRSNGSVEIWVQILDRGGQSAAVDQVIVPENSIAEIDEVSIRPIARQIAIKLYMEMGQISHLGTTYEGVQQLLLGFEASANQDWWSAISHYRKAMAVEESSQRQYGVGHFHLGSALIYQGNIIEGLQHLQTAEQDGPLSPETQYMIAFTLTQLYWRDVHRRPATFVEIENRLKRAIELRGNFPEAYQLLGTICYRHGKLLERLATREYDEKEPEITADQSYMRFYRQSARYLRRAISLYNRAQRLASTVPTHYSEAQNQASRIMRQRMTAAHQLGDALRSLTHYSEASTYYDDMRAVYPRNLRNLTDLTKTYCLAGTWQKAEEFLWRTVFRQDVAYWDADVCIHMGWALSGGVYHKLQSSAPLYKRIEKNIGHEIKGYAKTPTRQLLEAMGYIDYSVHQRPRYITFWHQSNWFKPFIHAIEKLQPMAEQVQTSRSATSEHPALTPFVESLNPVLTAKDDVDASFECGQLYRIMIWIALRIDSYGLYDSPLNAISEGTRALVDRPLVNGSVLWSLKGYMQQFFACLDPSLNGSASDFQKLRSEFQVYYILLKKYRRRVANFLQDTRQEPRLVGLELTYRRLEIANELYDSWIDAHEHYQKLEYCQRGNCSQDHKRPRAQAANEAQGQTLPPTLVDRWIIDVFAELSLLTIRMLAEAKAYEQVYHIAKEGCDALNDWAGWWTRHYEWKFETPEQQRVKHHYDKMFTFSPRVFRFHHASFYAWKAYAILHIQTDPVTQARVAALKTKHGDTEELGSTLINLLTNDPVFDPNEKSRIAAEIQITLDDAQTHIFYHPMRMYVQALLYRRQKLYAQAIEEFERLLDLIIPYDPRRNISGAVYVNEPQFVLEGSSWRLAMYYMEKVSGRQQFHDIVSVPQIHMEIAETYRMMDAPDLRVRHLTEAVRNSPYSDLDLDNLLRLANQLNQLEKYDNALAVIDAVEAEIEKLGSSYLSNAKRYSPDVLRSVVLTRRWLYGESFELARRIARRYKIHLDLNRLMGDQRELPMPFPQEYIDHGYAVLDHPGTDHDFTGSQQLVDAAERQRVAHQREIMTSIIQTISKPSIIFDDSPLGEEIDAIYANYSTERVHYPRHKMHQSHGLLSFFELLSFFTKKHKHIRMDTAQSDDDYPDNLLRNFRQMQLNGDATLMDNLNTLAKRARVSVLSTVEGFEEASFAPFQDTRPNELALSILLFMNRARVSDTLYFPLQIVFASSVIYHLSREASFQLSQIAELCNVLAYNRAEEGQHLRHAYTDSATAVIIIQYLHQCAPVNSRQRDAFAKKLAQFHDTFGWVRFRAFTRFSATAAPLGRDEKRLYLELQSLIGGNHIPGIMDKRWGPGAGIDVHDLIKAEQFMRRGIRYEQRRAILHYHLARIYLQWVELIWQMNSMAIAHRDTNQPKLFRYINVYLELAFRSWRTAQECDRFGRLHMKLAWLYNRLTEYRKAWSSRIHEDFSGVSQT
jgi:tetratricopeptide (TPR) repeat protein